MPGPGGPGFGGPGGPGFGGPGGHGPGGPGFGGPGGPMPGAFGIMNGGRPFYTYFTGGESHGVNNNAVNGLTKEELLAGCNETKPTLFQRIKQKWRDFIATID